ncbi:ABC-2 transporter permease [Wukongibacter sp. M2B1]|uniref:ABC-2 transporter permease n=1 Tax=Wukongibacter sp. M2B1 TaxID=3088895 RepID=UPI003D7A68C6
MYNLFLKDFYLIKKHLWFIMLYGFIIFFLFNIQGEDVAQGLSYSVGITIIGYTLMMYITAYDDKNNSEVFLNSLPISRSKIVFSRYLSILVFATIGILSMTIVGFVLKSFKLINSWNGVIGFNDLIISSVGLCIVSFLYLPTYFKYGYIKAKIFNWILFAVGFGGPMLIKGFLKDLEKPLWIDVFIKYLNSQSEFTIGLLIMISIMILGLVSLVCSIIIYKKREF